MRLTTRKMMSGVLLAAVAGLTACGDDAYTRGPSLEGSETSETMQAEQELVQRLRRAVGSGGEPP